MHCKFESVLETDRNKKSVARRQGRENQYRDGVRAREGSPSASFSGQLGDLDVYDLLGAKPSVFSFPACLAILRLTLEWYNNLAEHLLFCFVFFILGFLHPLLPLSTFYFHNVLFGTGKLRKRKVVPVMVIDSQT
jgi:hypothetical protein